MRETAIVNFQKFIIANRQPTGRTIQLDGRAHGAVFYLDVSLTSFRPNAENEEDMFCSVVFRFIKALGSHWVAPPQLYRKPVKRFQSVAATTLERWMKADIGTLKLVDECRVPSDDHTTIYPHKTDACARCEIMCAELDYLSQGKQRHEKQNDIGSLRPPDVIKEIKDEIFDIEEEIKHHRQEADRAIKQHLKYVDNAYDAYAEVERRINLLHMTCR